MIRVLLFLALVALMAFGVVWFADRPGDVAIVWQGIASRRRCWWLWSLSQSLR